MSVNEIYGQMLQSLPQEPSPELLNHLEETAKAAMRGEWYRDEQSGLGADVRVKHEDYPQKGYPVALTWGLWSSGAAESTQQKRKAFANANASFIAAAHPDAILCLTGYIRKIHEANQASVALAAWLDAEQKRLEAMDIYNAAFLASQNEVWPGRDINQEFHAMCAAQNVEFHARGALFASRMNAANTTQSTEEAA